MLSVLLTILKIIGMILLCLLLLILLIILAVLLVPIRYEADASMKESVPRVNVRVSWLLRFLCVRGRYGPDGFKYLAKVLGITVLDSEKPKNTGGTGADGMKTVAKDKISSKPAAKKAEAPKQGTAETKAKQTGSWDSAKTDKTEPVKEKKKIKEKISGIKEKIDGLIQKAKDIKGKIDEILEYLQSPEGKALTAFLKKKFYRLFRHLLPKAFRINARIGLSDPAATGQILGIAYMLYPFYGEHIRVAGEFEEEMIEGDVYVKGRIRLGALSLIAIQVILNKEVRKWIKQATGGNRK